MSTEANIPLQRNYKIVHKLKYGVNPQQSPAYILANTDSELPFTVLNGTPGYINLLDALNSIQLVIELKSATGLASAASFKHVSPAGVGCAVPLSDQLKQAYNITPDQQLTPVALAYLRARQADPMCSFGDYAAVSDRIDIQTAQFLKTEVSDGIIAPGYDSDALELLKTKKNGSYIIIQYDINYQLPELEYRELYGTVFVQGRNIAQCNKSQYHESHIVTRNKQLSDDVVRDLLIASICIKYTQSNSVAYAVDGQCIGIGAGQQSRVDCVKLAGSKVDKWWLRQYSRVVNLPFKSHIKRQDRVNARISYIDGEMSEPELNSFNDMLTEPVQPLTHDEKLQWCKQLTNVSLSSDAFFPFRDNIDQCSKHGVKYIVQPGGSVQDQTVTKAADEYNMCMVFTGQRLFHH